ncbi:hypothetical protein L228DRAFT_244635 [Xylona heveae TC161]|uniref:Uncharacterized protein n=1 Tax=Xylona heveae (strain CBS 132557 / TC161) TaxID=1328760 RepID=A0A165J502_XYLHT|nr:hypothetical protein L228DRAFT_244635 [Xylona heveae TC161]KZF25738.1 hypothetical protein L228DRAFT_244635 [Xylona heveae TC161]
MGPTREEQVKKVWLDDDGKMMVAQSVRLSGNLKLPWVYLSFSDGTEGFRGSLRVNEVKRECTSDQYLEGEVKSPDIAQSVITC